MLQYINIIEKNLKKWSNSGGTIPVKEFRFKNFNFIISSDVQNW